MKFETYKYASSDFIPSDYVSQVEVDKDNNLWAGFSNALLKYDGNIWEKRIQDRYIQSVFPMIILFLPELRRGYNKI